MTKRSVRTKPWCKVRMLQCPKCLKGRFLYKSSTMETDQPAPMNRCGYCGSTNYRRVVERDAQGLMRYGERLLCSGCTREFTDLDAWRQGASDASPPLSAAA